MPQNYEGKLGVKDKGNLQRGESGLIVFEGRLR